MEQTFRRRSFGVWLLGALSRSWSRHSFGCLGTRSDAQQDRPVDIDTEPLPETHGALNRYRFDRNYVYPSSGDYGVAKPVGISERYFLRIQAIWDYDESHDRCNCGEACWGFEFQGGKEISTFTLLHLKVSLMHQITKQVYCCIRQSFHAKYTVCVGKYILFSTNLSQVRPPKRRVAITEGENCLTVSSTPAYADHPLVVGPRYISKDINLSYSGPMDVDWSGVTVYRIGLSEFECLCSSFPQ